MIFRYASLLSVSAVVSGCSVGLAPGGHYPTTTFNVDVSYQEAYRRAEVSLRQCHAGSNPLMRAKHINGKPTTHHPVSNRENRMDFTVCHIDHGAIVVDHIQATSANAALEYAQKQGLVPLLAMRGMQRGWTSSPTMAPTSPGRRIANAAPCSFETTKATAGR